MTSVKNVEKDFKGHGGKLGLEQEIQNCKCQ